MFSGFLEGDPLSETKQCLKKFMICVRCGHQNPEGQHFCLKCNSALPRISESISAANPERVNVHYNLLREAGEKVQARQISMEEYLQTLDTIYTKIYERLQEVESMDMEDEVRSALQEQLNVGVSGIHYFLNGINEMRLYADDSDPQHIAIGISSVFQGNENLNQALEMARDNIRRLKDMGIDSEISIKEDLP